ncbi:hypothetical protein [Pararhizobium sp. LjRoot235]|uniref:hypothetical protein n=1 Tax=Pararhizobium sp. LjRoot235 TaxID=3342291 RepID=UPI003F5017FF
MNASKLKIFDPGNQRIPEQEPAELVDRLTKSIDPTSTLGAPPILHVRSIQQECLNKASRTLGKPQREIETIHTRGNNCHVRE